MHQNEYLSKISNRIPIKRSKETEEAIVEALKVEGGASGMDKLKELVPAEDFDESYKSLLDSGIIKVHEEGDIYIVEERVKLTPEEIKDPSAKVDNQQDVDYGYEVLKSIQLAGENTRIHDIKLSKRRHFSYNIDSLDFENSKEKGKGSFIVIKGIASSTSVDHYGTEMSYKALKEMEYQVKRGVVILPRHESLTGSGLAEWDEVIGRTFNGKVVSSSVEKPGAPNSRGFVLEVESRLYADDDRTKNLIKRLQRGEPIGQSIGGWFEEVRVEERDSGEIERIIVENVTLDHIAITRAPANPDSNGLNVLDIRSSIKSFLSRRKKMKKREADFDHLKEGLPVQEREIDINPELPVEAKPQEKVPEQPSADAGKEEAVAGSERLDDNSAMELKGKMEKMAEDYDALKAEYEALLEKIKEKVEDEDQMESSDEKVEMTEEERMMKEKMKEMMKEERMKEEERMKDEERMMKEKERMMEYMKEYMKEFMAEYGMHDAEEKKSALQNEQNTAEKLDNSTILNNSNSDNNFSRGDDMSPEDIAKIVTQVTRSILAEQNAVEPTEEIEKRTKIEAAHGTNDPSVEELKARLERAENTLNRVLEMPLRKGRHTSASIRGIGSETQMQHMIEETQKEGHQSLASVVKRYKSHIMRSSHTTVKDTLSIHELKDVLSKGLRAAYLDGLLGTPVDGWQ